MKTLILVTRVNNNYDYCSDHCVLHSIPYPYYFQCKHWLDWNQVQWWPTLLILTWTNSHVVFPVPGLGVTIAHHSQDPVNDPISVMSVKYVIVIKQSSHHRRVLASQPVPSRNSIFPIAITLNAALWSGVTFWLIMNWSMAIPGIVIMSQKYFINYVPTVVTIGHTHTTTTTTKHKVLRKHPKTDFS